METRHSGSKRFGYQSTTIISWPIRCFSASWWLSSTRMPFPDFCKFTRITSQRISRLSTHLSICSRKFSSTCLHSWHSLWSKYIVPARFTLRTRELFSYCLEASFCTSLWDSSFPTSSTRESTLLEDPFYSFGSFTGSTSTTWSPTTRPFSTKLHCYISASLFNILR